TAARRSVASLRHPAHPGHGRRRRASRLGGSPPPGGPPATPQRGGAPVARPLLRDGEHPAKVGVLVVTSDRGLAGSYNSNVLKIAEQQVESIRGRGLEPVLYISGKKGV